jgi:hypothetical protein
LLCNKRRDWRPNRSIECVPLSRLSVATPVLAGRRLIVAMYIPTSVRIGGASAWTWGEGERVVERKPKEIRDEEAARAFRSAMGRSAIWYSGTSAKTVLKSLETTDEADGSPPASGNFGLPRTF